MLLAAGVQQQNRNRGGGRGRKRASRSAAASATAVLRAARLSPRASASSACVGGWELCRLSGRPCTSQRVAVRCASMQESYQDCGANRAERASGEQLCLASANEVGIRACAAADISRGVETGGGSSAGAGGFASRCRCRSEVSSCASVPFFLSLGLAQSLRCSCCARTLQRALIEMMCIKCFTV